jgi:peptidyl-prolyl cis-trans isomerase SurA
MNTKNVVRSLSLICAALIICLQPVYARQSLDKIVAVVNNDSISQTELDNYTRLVTSEMSQQPGSVLPPKSVLQNQILNRMILDRIQLQLASQAGIELDSFTVSQALQGIAQQQGISMEQLKRSVEARGISFNEYRDIIKTDMTIQNLQSKEVAQNINVSKTDIEGFLNSPAGQDNSGTEYKLSHILLTTPESPTPDTLKAVQAQAEDMVIKLRNGADFNKMAMSKSAGRQALKGGDLGWRSAGEIPTIFVSYVPTMQVGEIAGPIRSASGFHIIKLQEKRISSEETRTETHVRQILIKPDANTSSEEAKDIILSLQQQITKGADFAKIAEQKSQENRTATKGGDMGWLTESSVLPKFYQHMNKLRANEISEPFETEEGWHIIQVLNRRTQRTSNEAARNKAQEILTIRKTNEALEAWMKRIRDEARVEILIAEDPSAKNS